MKLNFFQGISNEKIYFHLGHQNNFERNEQRFIANNEVNQCLHTVLPSYNQPHFIQNESQMIKDQLKKLKIL